MKKFTKEFFIGLIILVAFMFGFEVHAVTESVQSKVPEFYYLEAEVLNQDDTSTTFCSQQGDYVVDRTDIPIDNVYLLTMASNNTSDIKDDEIIVIWADMN